MTREWGFNDGQPTCVKANGKGSICNGGMRAVVSSESSPPINEETLTRSKLWSILGTNADINNKLGWRQEKYDMIGAVVHNRRQGRREWEWGYICFGELLQRQERDDLLYSLSSL